MGQPETFVFKFSHTKIKCSFSLFLSTKINFIISKPGIVTIMSKVLASGLNGREHFKSGFNYVESLEGASNKLRYREAL